MPTIAAYPSTATSRVRPTEAELLESAARIARAGAVLGAIRMLHEGQDTVDRARLGPELVALLADDDARVAAAVALALPAGPSQSAAVELAGRAWARHNPEEALPWAMNLVDVNAALAARRGVTTELVLHDAQAAIDRIQAFPISSARSDTLVLAAGAWARRSLDDALAWLDDLPEDDLRQRLTSSMGFEIAQTNPRRAVDLAAMLPPGRDRWLLVSAIGQTWVAVDPKAALTWAQQLPEDEGRDAALAGIDTGFGVPSSRRIASAPGIRGGAARTRGGTAAAAAARGIDEPTFALWLSTQPPGMSQEEAILEYVRQRGVANPHVVGQLLTTLPDGNLRQRAIDVHVENLLIGSPNQAAEFLRSLPRSEQSPEAIERTARRLLHTNPAAAEALLDQALLTPDQKAELLRQAPR